MKKNAGFSLLELMIVVAIVGIIAAVAYPSYQQQIQKTRRADCSGALVGLGNAMERFFTVNSTYVGASAGGPPGAPTIYATTCPVDGGNATYNLTIQAAGVSTYSIQAAPVNAQVGDKCGSLTLTNTGAKGVTGAHGGVTWDECWN